MVVENVAEEAVGLSKLTNVSSARGTVIGLETVQRNEEVEADQESETLTERREDASYARRKGTEQESAEKREMEVEGLDLDPGLEEAMTLET